MSNQKDLNVRNKKNDHPLKHLPADVLLKARSTLVSLSGALKSKQQEQQKNKDKCKEKSDRLRNSKSEPEFSDMQNNRRRSRIDEKSSEEFKIRPRPLSVGAKQRQYDDDDSYRCNSYSKESICNVSRYDSAEEVLVQSRLVIPITNDRLGGNELQQDTCDVGRPRKKLSFREPEIVNGCTATLGRSNKYMGVNSLNRRAQRLLPPDRQSPKSEGIDSDLEVSVFCFAHISAIFRLPRGILFEVRRLLVRQYRIFLVTSKNIEK